MSPEGFLGSPGRKPGSVRERKVTIDTLDIALHLARLADDRKATRITVLKVDEVMPLTEYFVILTCSSRRHVQALTEDLGQWLKHEEIAIPKIEGADFGGWTLVDSGPVVVHLFEERSREYYDLDNLWADAVVVDWMDGKDASALTGPGGDEKTR